MKVEVLKSFEKDIPKIKDKNLAIKLNDLLTDLETYKSISEISNLKKMIAKGSYYRARVGNFRLGFKIENNTIILIRFLDRKEIYRYFP